MKTIFRTLACCLAISGCAEDHVDILTTFHVVGMTDVILEGREVREGIAHIYIRDVNLDDSRRDEQRLIAAREVPVGEQFEFVERYFWGTMVADATQTLSYQEERIALKIEYRDCQPWNRELQMSEFPIENGEVLIELGTVVIQC